LCANLKFYRLDFNSEIHEGEDFKAIKKIVSDWEKYISKSFEELGSPISDGEGSDEGGDDSEPRKAARRISKVKHADPTKVVTREDGSIWINDFTGASREALQGMVCGFLTAHYSE